MIEQGGAGGDAAEDRRPPPGPPGPPELEIRRLGRLDYRQALELQQVTVRERIAERCGDVLLFVEHDPVITVGRRGTSGVAGLPFPVVEVERGGEATYHGPGQLVGYPILKLGAGERDLARYLRGLEQALILALARFGLAGVRRPPHTGVFVGERKIASIGVAVRRWVTFHGFALNVTTDLRAFRGFAPCGLPAAIMTSMAAELTSAPDPRAVEVAVAAGVASALCRRERCVR